MLNLARASSMTRKEQKYEHQSRSLIEPPRDQTESSLVQLLFRGEQNGAGKDRKAKGERQIQLALSTSFIPLGFPLASSRFVRSVPLAHPSMMIFRVPSRRSMAQRGSTVRPSQGEERAAVWSAFRCKWRRRTERARARATARERLARWESHQKQPKWANRVPNGWSTCAARRYSSNGSITRLAGHQSGCLGRARPRVSSNWRSRMPSERQEH